MVKSGFYKRHDMNDVVKAWGGTVSQPVNPTYPTSRRSTTRAAGINFDKIFQSPGLMAVVFGQADGEEGLNKMAGARLGQ